MTNGEYYWNELRRGLAVRLLSVLLVVGVLACGVVAGSQVWRMARCQQLSNQYAAALSVPPGSDSANSFRQNQTIARNIAETHDAYQRECS